VSESLSRGVVALTERVSASEANLHQGMTALQGAVDRTIEQSAAGARSQAATEQAMQRLTATLGELGTRLEELRDAHATLAPVLRQLSGPMEIRLMPAMISTGREPT
jgi:protein involved in temperature-dependent protein secretion